MASKENIKVKVEDGWVTLEGELNWNYQKDVAKKSINNLIGVKGVSNNITIKSETQDEIEKKDIEYALRHKWDINNWDIWVKVSDKRVTLSGIVVSLYQRDEAERIAWNTPGVSVVNNELVVDN